MPIRLQTGEVLHRIEQLVEASCEIVATASNVQFVMRFMKNSMTWRNILLITEGCKSYRSSVVPQRIFDSPAEIQKEFVRGLVDVCGFVRMANAFHGRHRVYIEIPAQNWALPVSLCRLLQVKLGVPVQMIQWNHPNTRIPNDLSATLTAREHQVKIFADAFLPIGFYVRYKQEILEELSQENLRDYAEPRPCNPNPDVHPDRKKPKHPEEKSKLIPKCIRGKHFNSYWQICTALGCKQCRDAYPGQGKMFRKEDEDDVETNQG